MSSLRRVVVTGLGIVSPVGSSVELAWSNILAGKSGIGPLDLYDVSQFTTRFAGLVSKDFVAEDALKAKELKKTDRFIHYGVAASKQAVKDSGLEITEANRERIAVLVGSGIGGIGKIEDEVGSLHKSGPKRVSPFLIPGSIINMVAGYASIELGITGPSFSPVSACTTAAHSIAMGARMIQAGDCDAALSGGAEAGSAPAGMAGFCQARALSTRNDDPERASRPWDRDRDGFVLGDGAGVLLLEEYEHAKARGAQIYAELIGLGMSSDAYHITLPPEDGNGARRAMENALRDGGINPTDVDYVNAHGTSTLAGDVAETVAVKHTFGDYASRLPVSSTKSMTGHLLGAAGGVEAAFCCLALRDQVIPPTINLDNPGEGCDLDYVPNEARQAKLNIVMSNSFGFGGTNGSLAFSKLK